VPIFDLIVLVSNLPLRQTLRIYNNAAGVVTPVCPTVSIVVQNINPKAFFRAFVVSGARVVEGGCYNEKSHSKEWLFSGDPGEVIFNTF
jgi:hypothetical protein